LKNRETHPRDARADHAGGDHEDQHHERRGAPAGDARRGDERQREEKCAQDRIGVEPDPAVEVREPARRPQRDREAAVEEARGDDEADVTRPTWRRVRLASDEEACERVDRDAEESQKVRWTPQRHVEPEQSMPEIVDRGRQHCQGDPPRRQVKAGRAGEAEDPRSTGGPMAGDQMPERVARQHAETDEDGDGHPGVGHEVWRDPERIPTDLHVRLDIPLHPPADQKVGR